MSFTRRQMTHGHVFDVSVPPFLPHAGVKLNVYGAGLVGIHGDIACGGLAHAHHAGSRLDMHDIPTWRNLHAEAATGVSGHSGSGCSV